MQEQGTQAVAAICSKQSELSVRSEQPLVLMPMQLHCTYLPKQAEIWWGAEREGGMC